MPEMINGSTPITMLIWFSNQKYESSKTSWFGIRQNKLPEAHAKRGPQSGLKFCSEKHSFLITERVWKKCDNSSYTNWVNFKVGTYLALKLRVLHGHVL